MVGAALEVLQIIALLPIADLGRRCAGPRRCVAVARALGRHRTPRSRDARLRLRQIIRSVDGRLPDGGNCYRRSLVEMALDRDSAAEELHFGLVRGGGPKSGHAWLTSDPADGRVYDAEFTI
jgi:hypothetical protein